MMRLLRSLLFTPGNHPRRLGTAFTLNADAVVLDLEDACPVAEKVAARATVVSALQSPRRALGYVRVNALSTEYGYGDLVAVVQHGVDGIMLAKVNASDEIKLADWMISQQERERGLPPGSVDLLPLIETGAGLAAVESIARASKRVRRLAFGAADMTRDLGIEWSREETELLALRTMLVLGSRAAGIEAPIDLAWIAPRDVEGFANSVRSGRVMGFQGKLCIHPDQIQAVNAAFSPTEAQVAKACRVIEVFRDAEVRGVAAVILDGEMIDYALVAQAEQVLARAKRVAGQA
jgi:citrate lyase subunit beta / citryl-CoA lyase